MYIICESSPSIILLEKIKLLLKIKLEFSLISIDPKKNKNYYIIY